MPRKESRLLTLPSSRPQAWPTHGWWPWNMPCLNHVLLPHLNTWTIFRLITQQNHIRMETRVYTLVKTGEYINSLWHGVISPCLKTRFYTPLIVSKYFTRMYSLSVWKCVSQLNTAWISPCLNSGKWTRLSAMMGSWCMDTTLKAYGQLSLLGLLHRTVSSPTTGLNYKLIVLNTPHTAPLK